MKPDSNISHAEIWDDSMLIESWKSAYEEYQRYHSIEACRSKPSETTSIENEGLSVVSNEKIEKTTNSCDEDALKFSQDSSSKQEAKEMPGSSDNQEKIATVSSPQANDQPSRNLPKNLIAEVKDEGMKNLMMSWYYAGYYTGLYEGQQNIRTTSRE